MIPADEALARLKAGNERFRNNVRDLDAMASIARREKSLDKQEPFAIILGCSDSRVPAEIVFDQGLGDLFVIRVAGNVVAPSLTGSVEFSAIKHQARQSIVNRIQPSVQTLLESGISDDNKLIKLATRANIRASVAHLRHGSQVLEDLCANDGLKIVGAEYILETGDVDFFTDQDHKTPDMIEY